MAKEIMCVIKDIDSGLYLSPYVYGSHWVDISQAQRYKIEKDNIKISDLTDLIWVDDVNAKIVKIEVTVSILEIGELVGKVKKDYPVTKDDFVSIKNNLRIFGKNHYNKHGTKLKPINILHHIIYNLVRDNFYLKGIELGKNKASITHSNILVAKRLILNTQLLSQALNKININLTIEKINNIQNKLKEQIES